VALANEEHRVSCLPSLHDHLAGYEPALDETLRENSQILRSEILEHRDCGK